MLIDLPRCADLLKLAVVHDDDPIAHGQGFFLIMGHVDEGDAEVFLKRLELQLHLLAQLQIQRPQRLIQKEQFRVVGEGSGDGNTLLLPAGELVRLPLSHLSELNQLQHGVHLFSDLRLAEPFFDQTEGHVVEDVHVREKGVVLKDRVDVPLIRRQIRHVPSFQLHGAFRRSLEPRDDAQRRCLSAAGGPQKGQKLAFIDGQVGWLEDLYAVKILCDVFKLCDDLAIAHDMWPPYGL